MAQDGTVRSDSPAGGANCPRVVHGRSSVNKMNQLYLVLGRPVKQDRGWSIGGRVDLLYGTDSVFNTVRGLETNGDLSPKWNRHRYGLAMPQCYMEVAAPWGDATTMKLGHFYTILGHETAMAVDNFFYSHSYAMMYGEPFSHTGILGSTRLGPMTVHAGLTRGWDNWEDNNNDFSFIGGLNFTSSDRRTSLAYAIHTGREQNEPQPNSNCRAVLSLVLKHQLTPYLQYVGQYDHGFEEQATVGGQDADWYGVNQYLLYTLDCAWKAGLRFEWFRDEDAVRVNTAQSADYFALTAGLNWTPTKQVVVRPGLRWDFVGNSSFRPFNDGNSHDQILLDCDVIVRF